MGFSNDMLYKDIESVELVSFTEKEYANWLRSMNKPIVEKNGQYWLKVKKGFYQTTHLFSKNDLEQIQFPNLATWGIRSALSIKDQDKANINYHLHMITGEKLENFSIDDLSSNRRSQIRRSFKKCDFVELLDKDVLYNEGFDLYKTSSDRIGRMNTQSKETYLPKCGNYINDGKNNHLVLAGFVDGRLGGYIEIVAVNGIAYLESANFHTFALPSYLSIGLHYHMIKICQKSPGIHTLVHGQVSHMKDSLRVYKKSLTFDEVQIPAFFKITPILRPVLKVILKKAFGAKM